MTDVLQYDNSTKWLNEEISGVVTQITDLCIMFDKKFIKVISYLNILLQIHAIMYIVCKCLVTELY